MVAAERTLTADRNESMDGRESTSAASPKEPRASSAGSRMVGSVGKAARVEPQQSRVFVAYF
jgi:hypothetical protein